MVKKMVMELEVPQEDEEKEIVQKNFANLDVGDHITTVAEVTQIKIDEETDPPKWVLYYLYDGTATIRVFRNRRLPYHVGDVIKIELGVLHGKPYKNKPQLDYRAIFMQRIEKDDPRYKRTLKNLAHKAVIRKSEIKELPDGARIKLFTRILNLHPKNGEKEKYQKVLISDVENKPISLWFPKECFPLFESLEEGECFVLKALVKTIEQNHSARYLSFEGFIQGKEAYADPVARLFFAERIRYHSGELSTYLDLWKTHVSDSYITYNVLGIILRAFRRDIFPNEE